MRTKQLINTSGSRRFWQSARKTVWAAPGRFRIRFVLSSWQWRCLEIAAALNGSYNQSESSFCAPEVARSLEGSPLKFKRMFVREIPKQRTVQPWAAIFANTPLGLRQFCTR
jgi:hypothetical protein